MPLGAVHPIYDVAQAAAEYGAARRQALVTSFSARALGGGLDLDALLAEAAAHAAAALRVERAQVLQHRPDTDDLLVRADQRRVAQPDAADLPLAA